MYGVVRCCTVDAMQMGPHAAGPGGAGRCCQLVCQLLCQSGALHATARVRCCGTVLRWMPQLREGAAVRCCGGCDGLRAVDAVQQLELFLMLCSRREPAGLLGAAPDRGLGQGRALLLQRRDYPGIQGLQPVVKVP